MAFSDPIKLLLATFEVKHEDVVKFLAEKTTDVLRDGVGELLEKAAIDPKDFANVLCEFIRLDQLKQQQFEDAVKAGKEIAVSLVELAVSDAETPPVVPMEMEKPKKMSLSDVVKLYKAQRTSQAATEEMRSATPVSTTATETVDDLQEFPFHVAVQQSGGDVTKFLEILDFVEEDDGDINETARVAVVVDKVHSTLEVRALSPTLFASYLGYVDVVKCLLGRLDVELEEKKFVTIGRAQGRMTVK